MAHAPIFDVEVETWEPRSKGPRAVAVVCKKCGATFRATEADRAGDDTFATYLGAIHLQCPRCKAQGPVQLRRLKKV